MIAESIASRTEEVYEFVSKAKDGTTFPVEARPRTVFVGDREFRIGAIRDLRESRQAEEALRRSEERLRLVLEATGDGIWDWDLRTDQTYFSPRYYSMLGYDPDEFPSGCESWRRLANPDDLEATDSIIHEALQHHTPFSAQFRMKAKNGE